MTTHTPYLSVLQDQNPEPLALSWSAWEPRPRQQVVSAPASQSSQAKASCCTPYRPRPAAAPKTLAGSSLLSTRTVTLTVTKDQLPPRLKTPTSPSSKRWMAGKRRFVTACDSWGDGSDPGRNLFFLTSDPGHISRPCNSYTHQADRSRSTLAHQPAGRTKKSPGKEQGPPNKSPTRTTRATKGTKGREHRNQTPLGATSDLPATTKSTASSCYRRSGWRPSTPACPSWARDEKEQDEHAP